MIANRKILSPTVAALVISGIAALFSLGLMGCDGSKEIRHSKQEVEVEQVPAAVRDTIEQERKGGTLKEIEKITVEGKTVYDADMVVNGKNHQTLVAEDGKVIARDFRLRGEEEDDD